MKSHKLAFGLSINWRDLKLTRGKKSLELTRHQLLLVEMLATNDDYTHSDLLSNIFSGLRSDSSLKVQIYRLRQEIGILGISIENKRNVGYRIVEKA